MSELLLDKNLGESDKGAVQEIVANARTLAVIRSLEGDQRGRKSQVIRFVSESNLIGKIDLSGADLSRAKLGEADLSRAKLREASLVEANLVKADLRDADLIGTNGWTNEQLAQADSLVGATMPDGTVMTEEAWEEFKKRHRQ
jgi:hypothetical protein